MTDPLSRRLLMIVDASMIRTLNMHETDTLLEAAKFIEDHMRNADDMGMPPGNAADAIREAAETPPNPDVPSLESSLREVLNRHSAENGSDTPDFILAEYVTGCLDAFNQAVRSREKWYGRREFV